MRQIRINVIGPVEEGKSLAISVCKQALESAGFTVETDQSVGDYPKDYLGLQGISEPCTVSIKETVG